MPSFIAEELPKLLDVEPSNLERSFKNGNIKFLPKSGDKRPSISKIGWKNRIRYNGLFRR